ncbi:hypothetical protein EMIT0194P_180112 [Pseudomonas serbica]
MGIRCVEKYNPAEQRPARRAKIRQHTPLKKETQLALWISLGTLCRLSELLQAEWKNVDLPQQTWFLPSENVKVTRGKKQNHHVFLSPFALHFFQELKTLTGNFQWCFPYKQDDGHMDVKVVSKQVGDHQARFKKRKAPSRASRRYLGPC